MGWDGLRVGSSEAASDIAAGPQQTHETKDSA
jgi:hypothetical protein